MRFRKKPIIVNAEQWHFGKMPLDGMVYQDSDGYYYINTLEGLLKVSDGDWIIIGIAGEKYPCKPDIFEKTYEPV